MMPPSIAGTENWYMLSGIGCGGVLLKNENMMMVVM